MRRDVPAFRPIRRCAFAIALVVGMGAAAAETVVLRYDLSVSGIGVAEMAITATLTDVGYTVEARGETYGAAALFDDLAIYARVVGTLSGGTVTPQAFGTNNILNGNQRRARVTWSAEREGVTTELLPTLAEEERSPIPDEARHDSLDPISALFSFALGAPHSGTCSGAAKVFDGRRSYTLALLPVVGGTYEKLDIGDREIVALKCIIQSTRTGGASPDSMLSGSGGAEQASIWFWLDGKGRAIPARVEAEAPVGYAVGQLASLPN